MKQISYHLLFVFTGVIILFSSCSTYNLKTVETVPVGENEATLGFGLWLMYFDHNPDEEPVLEINEDLEEGPEKIIIPSITFTQRFGVFNNLEIGYSIDGPYWPGIGGKLQILSWFAVDGNVKLVLPVYNGNPPTHLFYDASAILGYKNFYFGAKYLPSGVVAGSDDWYEQDTALFIGYKIVTGEKGKDIIIPEIMYYTTRKEFAIGFGMVF
jgi:hypothetical protein